MSSTNPFERAAEMYEDERQTPAAMWDPYEWQVPPLGIDNDVHVRGWLLLGGRGVGKTDGAAHYLDEHMQGPPCYPRLRGGHRAAIIAPTLGDASDSCVNGPSGLRAYNPFVREITRKGGTYVTWPGGAEAKLFGAYTPQDVERLRAGGNRCISWLEELAAWRYLEECFTHMNLGLRLGHHPRWVGSTTPKPRPKIGELIALADKGTVVLTHGRTRDAYHLDPVTRQNYLDTYAGTSVERQELEGEYIEDAEGAAWNSETIALHRWPTDMEVPELSRIIVGVDPSGSDAPTAAEAGILVAGLSARPMATKIDGVTRLLPHAFVIGDRSMRATPERWGREVCAAFAESNANKVAAERNYGGQLVRATLRAINPGLPLDLVSATVGHGKITRAEPVAQMYQQGRVHHVGNFPELERQMTTWEPDSGQPSPDRMDALVYAITSLLPGMVSMPGRLSGMAKRRVG